MRHTHFRRRTGVPFGWLALWVVACSQLITLAAYPAIRDLPWRPPALGEVSTLRFLDDKPRELEAAIDATPPGVYYFGHAADRRLPGEFEPQSGLLVAGGALANVAPAVLHDLATATQGLLPLVALVDDSEQLKAASDCISSDHLKNVRFVLARHNTIWCRDYGPAVITTANRSAVVLDFKYAQDERSDDDAVPAVLSHDANVQCQEPDVYLPGGNLLSNGRGICITTTRVQADNPGISQTQLAELIASSYGADRVVILRPLEGEPTGHVDMFATFTGPQTVVVGSYRASDDPVNAEILDSNANQLAQVRTKSGSYLRVIRIPMPTRQDDKWPTYTNVVYANQRILVPSYASSTPDELAIVRTVYALHLPRLWDIRFVPADDLIVVGGALHCVVLNLGALEPNSLPAFDARLERERGKTRQLRHRREKYPYRFPGLAQR